MPAKRHLSQLRYERIQDGAGSPRVITLHKHNQYGDGIADLARTAAPDGHLIGLESFKGIFIGRDIVGYTWFLGPLDRPAPLFFGDSLAEIERFLWDYLDMQETARPERPFLIGAEQGAIMALATALAAPDLLSGVIAVDGALPLVPGWDPPLAPLDGLPILVLGDLAEASDERVLRREALSRQLAEWGANATWQSEAPSPERDRRMRNWLAAQQPRMGYPDEPSPPGDD